MNDSQRLRKLNAAVRDLKRTTNGYRQAPTGVHWRNGLAKLDQLAKDLAPSQVPPLGPVVKGGKSVLDQDLTHITDGLTAGGSVWPAFDDAVGHSGMVVVAPEAGTVTGHGNARRRDGRPDGKSINIFRGVSGIEYWIGHLENLVPVGARVAKGGRLGTISPNHEAPHVHVGINARPLVGHDLAHHTNYTKGAPTVGAQLRAANL